MKHLMPEKILSALTLAYLTSKSAVKPPLPEYSDTRSLKPSTQQAFKQSVTRCRKVHSMVKLSCPVLN